MWSYLMHNVGHIDYMMKVSLVMHIVTKVVMLIYEVNDDTCGLFLGLFSMCEAMRIHMYIALVCLDWDYG